MGHKAGGSGKWGDGGWGGLLRLCPPPPSPSQGNSWSLLLFSAGVEVVIAALLCICLWLSLGEAGGTPTAATVMVPQGRSGTSAMLGHGRVAMEVPWGGWCMEGQGCQTQWAQHGGEDSASYCL